MYLLIISSADGCPSAWLSTSSISWDPGPYTFSKDGVVAGRSRPRWQLQQVTTCRPEKLVRFIAVIITTILRAITFLGVSAAQSTFSVPAFALHSQQSIPMAADIIPTAPT